MMIVFLRNIPAQTRREDIIVFIEPALKTHFFGKKGVIETIQVLQLKDKDTNISEFHGLVAIEPDAAAIKVIKRLNRKKFLNKFIAVREYQPRSWHNDPRVDYDSAHKSRPERRSLDRRRRNIEILYR